MTVQTDTGDIFSGVKSCTVTYKDGGQETFMSEKTELLYLHLSEIKLFTINI